MLSTRSLSHILAFFAVAQAAVITTESPGVSTSITRDVSHWNITSIESPPSPFLDVSVLTPPSPDLGERALVAALGTNAAIAVSACTFGGPYACIGVGITAIVFSFFEFFRATSVPAGSPVVALSGGRGTLLLTHPQWQATAECGLGCQLQAGVEQETWTHFANATVKGVPHTMHYYRSGTFNGLKAVSVGNGTAAGAKRDDDDDEDGIVTSYFWDDGNENAWASFDTDDEEVGLDSEIEMYMQGGNFDIICADLQDSAGTVDTGIMTVGLNNDELVLSNMQSSLNLCGTLE